MIKEPSQILPLDMFLSKINLMTSSCKTHLTQIYFISNPCYCLDLESSKCIGRWISHQNPPWDTLSNLDYFFVFDVYCEQMAKQAKASRTQRCVVSCAMMTVRVRGTFCFAMIMTTGVIMHPGIRTTHMTLQRDRVIPAVTDYI